MQNADLGPEQRNRLSLLGRQKKHSEFMLKKYMDEKRERVRKKEDLEKKKYNNLNRLSQAAPSRVSRSNAATTRPSLNAGKSNNRPSQVSSSKNLSPKLDKTPPFLGRGGNGQSLPKLDKVFKLD